MQFLKSQEHIIRTDILIDGFMIKTLTTENNSEFVISRSTVRVRFPAFKINGLWLNAITHFYTNGTT